MVSVEEDAGPARSLGSQAVLRCKPPWLLHWITSQGAPPGCSPASDQGAKLLNSEDQAHLVVQSTSSNPGLFVVVVLISNQANIYVHLIPMSFIHSVLGKRKTNMLIYWPLRMPIPLTSNLSQCRHCHRHDHQTAMQPQDSINMPSGQGEQRNH